MRRRLVAWIGALLLCPFSGAGGAPDSANATTTDSTGTESLAAIIESLEPNSLIRVQPVSGKLIEGELQGHDGRQLTVLVDVFETSTVAMDDANTLWLPGGNKQRQGAMIGGVTGAVVGGLLFVSLAAFWSAGSGGGDYSPHVGYFFLGVACGWPVGAVVGGAVGAGAIEWDKRYP